MSKLLGGAAAFLLLTGCVERTIQVRTDPPGATVYIDGRVAGASPVIQRFDFYGAHEIVIQQTGRRTVRRSIELPVPPYQWLGVDFVAENLLPYTIHDDHVFSFVLEEDDPSVGEKGIIERAEALRARGLPRPDGGR